MRYVIPDAIRDIKEYYFTKRTYELFFSDNPFEINLYLTKRTTVGTIFIYTKQNKMKLLLLLQNICYHFISCFA